MIFQHLYKYNLPEFVYGLNLLCTEPEHLKHLNKLTLLGKIHVDEDL